MTNFKGPAITVPSEPSIARDTIIKGFGFTGYRSFWSPNTQLLRLVSQVNLLAGINNSGKSNVLRFAVQYLDALASNPSGVDKAAFPELSAWDRPIGLPDSAGLKISLAFEPNENTLKTLFNLLQGRGERHYDAFTWLLSRPAFQKDDSGLVWVDMEVNDHGITPSHYQLSKALNQYHTGAAPTANGQLLSLIALLKAANAQNADDEEVAIQKLISGMKLWQHLPSVASIDAMRAISVAEDQNSHSGAGLILKLAALQNPLGHDDSALRRFEEINRFVRAVLEDESASIHIPYTHDVIMIKNRDRILPLENLGSGIQQVLILAAAATTIEDRIVCVEEPEVHLHPIYQRRLLQYLAEHTTTNRYLIATHSAHMLNTNLASVSHLTLSRSGTQVAPAVTPSELSRLSAELGYKASDIVQANCVIWVEGPSDRTYLRHWIGLIDRRIVEGIHYTIMFYGGKLLSHLSAANIDVTTDAIALRKLNRNMAVMIDSDVTGPKKSINATKQRIIDELLGDDYNHTWVTDGYSIENYVPTAVLQEAVEQVHKGAKLAWRGNKYRNPLAAKSLAGKVPSQVDKVAIAEAVTAKWSELEKGRMRLRDQVDKLVELICRANDLER